MEFNSRDKWEARESNRWPSILVVGPSLLLAALVIVLTLPLWTNSLPFADDYHLAFEAREVGFWSPTRVFTEQWAAYRIGYTVMLSPVYAMSQHLWMIRLLGILGHIAAVGCAGFVWKRLGGSLIGSLALMATIGLFPYSLEAIGWPATIAEYVLAPLLVFAGAAISLSRSDTSVTRNMLGGAVMGTAMFFHEQVAPIIVFLMIAIWLKKRRQSRPFLVAAAVPAVMAMGAVALTAGSNVRLTGTSGGGLGHLYQNLGFLSTHLRKATPFGSLYYDTGMVTWQSALAIGAAILLLVLFFIRQGETGEAGEPSARMSLYLVAAGIVCAVISAAPVVASPVPWFTPRVLYIPMYAVGIAVAATVQLIPKLWHTRMGYRAEVLLVVAIAGWGAIALNAEARAYNDQLRVNTQRLDSLVSLVQPDSDLTDRSLLVVAGFPGTDVERPQFGEHIIGITPGSIRAELGYRVYKASRLPLMNIRSAWEGLCLEPDLVLSLDNDYLRSRELLTNVDWSDRAPTYVVWVDGRWAVQRSGVPNDAIKQLVGVLPECRESTG